MYLSAFIFSFCITNLVNKIQVKEWILLLWQSKWELLALQTTGFVTNGVSYNVASGYVSALLIATLIIHFLLKNNYKIFINIIAPLFIMCGYARLIQVYGNISQWLAFDAIICSGVIRALAGMSVGVLSYIIMVPFFRKMKMQRILIFKILIEIALFCLVKYRSYITGEDLVFYIFLFALLIITSYCQKNIYFDKINKLMIYLGKLSYPIFLFHFGTLLFLKEYYGNWNYNNMMIVFLVIIIIEGIVLSNFKKLFDYRKL